MQILPTIALALACALAPGLARATDLVDLLGEVAKPFSDETIATPIDCVFQVQCDPDAVADNLFAGRPLDSLRAVSDFTTSVVNDRIVPFSSTVTGFTYEYNEDLDVYERSTSTFGPLFAERAQTLGARRFLIGASHSFLEFDEFDGTGIDDIPLSRLSGFLDLGGSRDTASAASVLDLSNDFDLNYDIEIRQSVSTIYFTYGVSDRVDVGMVVPWISIDMDAQATATLKSGAPLIQCSKADAFSTEPCLIPDPALASRRRSEKHSGIGDVVVRGKWHFYDRRNTDIAALLTISLPTGDEDNLAGFGDPTYTPGIVFSRDFRTDMGGVGIHGFLGYEFRGDDTDKNEIEFALGGSIQPFGRTSLALDLIGTSEPSGDKFDVLDLSVGAKLMLGQGILLDFNYITPLNDEGLRPTGGIFTAQLEIVFGD